MTFKRPNQTCISSIYTSVNGHNIINLEIKSRIVYTHLKNYIF